MLKRLLAWWLPPVEVNPETQDLVRGRNVSKKFIDVVLKNERSQLEWVSKKIMHGPEPSPAHAARLAQIYNETVNNIATWEELKTLPKAKLGRKYTCYGCGQVYRDNRPKVSDRNRSLFSPIKVRRCPHCGRVRYKSWDTGFQSSDSGF